MGAETIEMLRLRKRHEYEQTGIIAVSYTHLDVYKRQTIRRSGDRRNNI